RVTPLCVHAATGPPRTPPPKRAQLRRMSRSMTAQPGHAEFAGLSPRCSTRLLQAAHANRHAEDLMSHPRAVVATLLLLPAACQVTDDAWGTESANLGGPAIDLVAIGSITGHRADRSRATSGVLENGVAGNQLGGLGSGLDYAGFHLFLAIPD